MDLTDEAIENLKKRFSIDEIVESNNFSFIRILGQGGQGVVVLVIDNTGIEKAVKIMKLPTSSGRANRIKIDRLKNDIDFCLQPNHENIIQYDLYGEYPNNGEKVKFLYAVMDYYPQTLRDVINHREDYSPLQRLNFLIQLIKAVNDAHDKRIIHRDIKPENVLIKDSHLVLSDFGIAHFEDAGLTVSDDLLVNRNYLSPEQKIEGNALTITFASDIYSLGLIINECFTGENPAGSDYQHIEQYYPYLFELDNLADRMMSSRADERPTADSVRIKLKIYDDDIRSQLGEIKHSLRTGMIAEDSILKTAAEDLIFADHALKALNDDALQNLNPNYHCSLSYSVTEDLYSNFIQHRLLTECDKKFTYESHNYLDGKYYEPLDINHKEEHKYLYDRMKEILINIGGNKILSGKILKLFISCQDYHCEEILREIDQIITDSKDNIIDVPVLWLVKYLKSNAFNFDYNFNGDKLFEHVKLVEFRENKVGTPLELALFENQLDFFKKKEEKLLTILNTIRNRYHIEFDQISRENYSLKFDNAYNAGSFDKFKEYCISETEPGSAFEADVYDMLRNLKENINEGVIELIVSKDWDVEVTLRKIFIN
ncbi:Serine/threonine-protein kinase PrkC [Streptococcus sp. BCA20]|jgi:non-specific serine/threonine protein kinase|uniref:serine/threonine-protein kinase n=1 Tax=Streptococcus oralis TaxID=1303 RepID=UPI000F659444|nr:serine/threonine-protein kinase [Streptococcus oralis]MDU8037819.1 serine/threonine-protein kinase [Streptococcus sp.]RSH96372.1 Serine/threonine-protein kinase PrkC [Streptococcus oralis]RSJ36284.1 Serine/threonine-protein kinase PrkC [Streptococcus sp. BCA20]